MSPRSPFSQPPSALVAAVALTLVTTAAGSAADVGSLAPGSSRSAHAEAVTEPSSPPAALGLRTDRLSAKQRERWQPIVELVFAGDDRGRPLHPTLRRLWDDVTASGHDVYLELPEPSLSMCAAAGLFRIESVRPDGHIVAVVRLNLKTIDRGRVGDATPRGFRRFRGLTRAGRYAEVLGHELSHAAWTLADPARARHLLALQSQLTGLASSFLKAKRDDRPEIRRRMRTLDEQLETFEESARAAEAQVWEELVASQQARGIRNASTSAPDPVARSSRLSEGEVD